MKLTLPKLKFEFINDINFNNIFTSVRNIFVEEVITIVAF